MQRTLAIELQKLSVQFRKQQKAYLNKLRKTSAASSSFSLLDETGPTARVDEEYDPGFSEIQVCSLPAQRTVRGSAKPQDRLKIVLLIPALPAVSSAWCVEGPYHWVASCSSHHAKLIKPICQ